MAVLGKEAASALAAVESQQQRMTLQRIVSLVCFLTCGSIERIINSFLLIIVLHEDIYLRVALFFLLVSETKEKPL